MLRLILLILIGCIHMTVHAQVQTKTGVVSFKNGKTKVVEVLSDGITSDWTSVTVRDRGVNIEIPADSLNYLTIGDNQRYESRQIDVIRKGNAPPNSSGVAFMQVLEEGALKLFLYKTHFMFIEDEHGVLHKIYIVVKEYDSMVNKNLLKVDTIGFLRLEKGIYYFGNEHINILKQILSPDVRVDPKMKFSESNIINLVRDYNKLKQSNTEQRSYFTRKFKLHLTGAMAFSDIGSSVSDKVIEIGTEISFPSRYPTKSFIFSLGIADESTKINLGFREYILTNYALNPYGTIGFTHFEREDSRNTTTSMFLELGLRYVPSPLFHLHLSLSSPQFPVIKTGLALTF